MQKKYTMVILIILILTGCSDKNDSQKNTKNVTETKKLSKEVRQCVLEGQPLLDVMSPEKLVQTCIEKISKEKSRKKYQNIDPFNR